MNFNKTKKEQLQNSLICLTLGLFQLFQASGTYSLATLQRVSNVLVPTTKQLMHL